MARSFLTPINLNKLELQNARIQNLATAPTSPVVGQIYYDTALNGLYIWNGTAWALAGGISAGALASRPSASAVASGTFFYATDNFLIYYSNGTTWQQVDNFGSGQSTSVTISGTSSDGSSTNFARADHTHAGPGFGTVTSTTSYGLTASSGTATTVAHSDHTHGTPSLSTNAASAVNGTTSSAGATGIASDAGHVHGFTPSSFTLDVFSSPVAAVNFGSQRLTNLADPTAAQDAATKNYVDGIAQGLNVHDSALVATISNLAWTYANGSADTSQGLGIGATLTNTVTGTSAIDGYTLQVNDRVLVKNQTTKTQNGIYTVTTAGTTGVATVLTRAVDANNHIPGQVTAGDFIFVSGVPGTTSQTSQGWSQIDSGTATTPPKAIKIGTDNIEFSQFSGAGTYTASNGVTLTGSNFTFTPLSTGGLQTGASGASILLPSTSGLATSSSGLTLNPTSTGGLTTNSSGALIKLATTSGLVTDSNGLYVGAGSGIVVNSNNVAIDTTVVVRKYAASIGDGATTSFTVTHNLGTKDVQVTLYDNSTNVEYFADVTHSTTNTLTVAFAAAPTTNQIRVVVFG